jgi:N-methylhydantoinase A/oxoprolinase/acetone carboxylase beta subunit
MFLFQFYIKKVIKMHYGLGIDAGGTYTDAVILRGSDGAIVDAKKSFTTYPDIQQGIKNVLDSLNQKYLRDVNLVSVSTTLSTNALLENTGRPVGLILVGEQATDKEYPAESIVFVSGGHDTNGEEEYPLDIEAVRDYVETSKSWVSAYAVSAYFGNRNPEHELAVKSIIHSITDLPVVCGHELSQELGVYERAVTAALNAQLIPITYQFVNGVVSDIKRRGINARLLMLKCDGSVYNIEDALEKPIETIFSGPAASILGASYLAKLDTCAVIDVGGTSTDVSAIKNGIPQISSEGCMVGGWKTRVKAMKMETSALGGDSHVWVKDKKLYIGPRRVIPLCVGAVMYPDFLNRLKSAKMVLRKDTSENYQQTKFVFRTEYEAGGLREKEKEILKLVGNEPVSVTEITDMTDARELMLTNKTLDSLINKRLIQSIGFTPTDALHVLGEYEQWNKEASEIGAFYLSKYANMGKYEFCRHVKDLFAKNMAHNLMSFLIPIISNSAIDEVLSGNYPVRFKTDIPVVLLGGPVSAYVNELKSLIDSDVHVPEFASVGNAVGALVGKSVKRVEILIKPASLLNPDNDFLVFSSEGRKRFETYSDAVDYAIKMGNSLVLDYEKRCGIIKEDTIVNVSTQTMSPENWSHPPLETRITVVGVGDPLMAIRGIYNNNNS